MALHSAPAGPAAAATPLWLKVTPVVFLLLWSGGFVLAKFGLEYAPPLTFLAIRYWFVIVVLLPMFLVIRPPVPGRASEWGHLIVVGALVQGLYFSLCHVGYWLGITTGTMALIVSLQPIMIGLLAPHLVAEHVGITRWLGLLLGLVGAGIVIIATSEVALTSGLGLLCAALALLTITGGTLYEKRFGVSHHPITSNLVQFLVGFVLILAFALALEDMVVRWTAEFALAMAYLVIGNSLIAVTLLLAMFRHGEAARVSALLFLVPPTVSLIAWGILGESMPPAAWIGMAVAVAGVALATRKLRVRKRANREL